MYNAVVFIAMAGVPMRLFRLVDGPYEGSLLSLGRAVLVIVRRFCRLRLARGPRQISTLLSGWHGKGVFR